MAEKPPTTDRDKEGDDEGKNEAPGFLFHTVDQVHAEERGDARGGRHDRGA